MPEAFYHIGVRSMQRKKEANISWVNPFKPNTAGLYHKTYHSQVLGKKAGYSIYLPPGYNRHTRPYPTIYWLHGKGGNESTGPQYGIPRFLHQAVSEKKIPETIMVFPNGAEYSMFSDSLDRSIPVETMITEELIPLIDNTYHTTGRRKGRAVEGFSMGGNGAVKLAFKFPQLFCSAVSYAGSFHDLKSVSEGRPAVYKKIFGANSTYYQQNSVFELAVKNQKKIQEKIGLKCITGTQDFTLSSNHKLFTLLDQLGIVYERKILEGFHHVVEPYYQQEGLAGFQFHFNQF